MDAEQSAATAELSVRNIGGISETAVTVEPGVTVLAGRNATNRTSLLQAIMAVLGSDDVAVKTDADDATVDLELAGEQYTRTFTRQGDSVRAGGDPYLDDPTLADLFAFLLESNEARRAVVTDAELRSIIMEPVDTDEIQAEIDRLLDRRRDVTAELEELEELKDRLPALESERTRLQSEIEDKRAALEDIEARLEAADANVPGEDEQAELEARLERLRNKRADLEDVRYNLETERDSLASLQDEHAEVESEYERLPDAPAAELDSIESRIDRLRTEKRRLESDLSDLQSVIGFNQDVLEDGGRSFLGTLGDDTDEGAVTDELLAEDTVTCWTCGSSVEPDRIEATLETLRDLSQRLFADINDIDDQLDEAKADQRELREQKQRRERLEQRRERLTEEIETTESRIADLTDRRDELRQDVEAIEAAVETLESDAYEEILDLHREANQLEYDLGTLESELDRVEDNIATIEDRLDEEATLVERRETLNEQLRECRTRIERIEKQAIEQFNDHMDTVLDRLEYDNIERIWLERTEREVTEGRRTVTESTFDLHIVRRTNSGTTYEDTIDNLSESEREVTGLVFALAGYLTHEVYETVPFMLLDSLEAIDADRIAGLVEYLAEFSEYLVVALLPEDAAALPSKYPRITDI